MRRLTVGKTKGSGFGTKSKIGTSRKNHRLRTRGSRGY